MDKKWIFIFVISVFLFVGNSAEAKKGAWGKIIGQYQCLEVKRFHVDRRDYSSPEAERAAKIPEHIIGDLQFRIAGEIDRSKLFSQVVISGQGQCVGKTVFLEGTVKEYKKGHRALRWGVGFGTGKQKFSVLTKLVDGASAKVLAEKMVIDRKVGGFAGGSAEKGQRDFAEKVAKFVKKGK